MGEHEMTHADESEEELVSQLVYSSAATEPFDDAQLIELLRLARRKNARLGVTGMLLYHAGTFVQMLEGDEEVVESLFARIEEDPRHDETRVLLRRSDVPRTFGEWTMGFVQATREMIATIDGLNDFLRARAGVSDEDLSSASSQDDGDRALKILEQFRAGRWRREIQGDRG